MLKPYQKSSRLSEMPDVTNLRSPGLVYWLKNNHDLASSFFSTLRRYNTYNAYFQDRHQPPLWYLQRRKVDSRVSNSKSSTIMRVGIL